jgi:acetoin utilization protein AcuB
MMNEPLHTIMTTEIVSITPDTTLAEVREILLKKRIHHLPVLEGKKLAGLLTTWDLFKLGKSVEEYSTMKAYELMTTHLATLNPNDHIGAAAEIFEEHLFQAVPVVNEDYELVGMVTTYDLLDYEYKKEYPENLDPFVTQNM